MGLQIKQFMKRTLAILFLSSIFIFSACKKDDLEDIHAKLTDNQWELSYVYSNDSNEKIKFPKEIDTKVWIQFSPDSDSLIFKGTCNNGGGNYNYPSSIESYHLIEISSIWSTMMNCNNIEWEYYITENLPQAYEFRLKSKKLEIYTQGDYNLFFKKH